jgi:hypothetical protein
VNAQLRRTRYGNSQLNPILARSEKKKEIGLPEKIFMYRLHKKAVLAPARSAAMKAARWAQAKSFIVLPGERGNCRKV